jgi:hypothetical protein
MNVRAQVLVIGLMACSFEPPVRAAADAEPDDDDDDDGIVEGADNCPAIGNADQLDFDGDDRGDACDGCPHLPSGDDPDGDGDGIGDACDPRPALAGDRRVVWTAFRDAAEIAGWIGAGPGTWMLTADGLAQTDVTAAFTKFGPTSVFTRTYVAIALRYEAAGTGNFLLAGINTGSVARMQFYGCAAGIENPGAQQQVQAIAASVGSPQHGPHVAWAGQLVGGDFAIVDDPTSEALCRFAQPGVVEVSASAGPLGPTAGGIEVFTQNATATFRYLFAVEIGGS